MSGDHKDGFQAPGRDLTTMNQRVCCIHRDIEVIYIYISMCFNHKFA